MLLSNVSLIFLELLQSLGHNNCDECAKNLHYDTLNDIIDVAKIERPIETIIFFGHEHHVEHFIQLIQPGIPKMIITQNCELDLILERTFSNNIFFLAFGKLTGSKRWQYLTKVLDNLQRHVRGIFVASYQNRGNLLEHFEWCWHSGFVHAIALVEMPKIKYKNQTAIESKFHLFTYTPFPVVNITAKGPKNFTEESYFSNKLSNLKGYKLRTAAYYDPPRIFPVKDAIAGYAAGVYREFLKQHYGQLEIVPNSDSKLQYADVDSVIRLLKSNQADLSMNVVFQLSGMRTTYPLTMAKWCILVPSSGGIPAYAYFLRPFQTKTWLAYIAMLVFLSFVASLNEYINAVVRLGYERAHFGFGRAFLDIFRLMLNVSTPHRYPCFKLHYAFTHILVAWFGFILANFYLAVLTSYRTSNIFERQIDTLQEMIDRNITINAVNYEVPSILMNNESPKGFTELLRPRGWKNILTDLLRQKSPNDQAYLLREDSLDFVLAQQQNELQPKFYKAKECVATLPVGFLMPRHSQFKPALDIFTLQATATGLLGRWFENAVDDGFRSGLLKMRKHKAHKSEPLTLNHFQSAFLVLVIGSILASWSFICEQYRRFRFETSIRLKSSYKKKQRIKFLN